MISIKQQYITNQSHYILRSTLKKIQKIVQVRKEVAEIRIIIRMNHRRGKENHYAQSEISLWSILVKHMVVNCKI